MLPDAMGNTSAGAAHEVLGLLSKLTEMMDSLSSEVTARVIEPINGYLSGELAEAKHQYGGFLDFQKRGGKGRGRRFSTNAALGSFPPGSRAGYPAAAHTFSLGTFFP